MTKIEYIESKRFGMIQLYEKLNEYYEEHNHSFTDLSIDDLTKITQDIDRSNFERGQNQEIWYQRCNNCQSVKHETGE